MDTQDSYPGGTTSDDAAAIDTGMSPFYSATNFFLETILSPKSVSELYSKVDLGDKDAVRDSLNNDFDIWIEHYVEYFVCALFAVIYILAVPIIGIVICCCRSRGRKCCGDLDTVESKHETCKRRSCCVTSFVICTMLMVAVTAGFIATGLTYEEATDEGFTLTFNHSLSLLDDFSDSTVNQFESLYSKEFKNEIGNVSENVAKIPEECQKDLGHKTGTQALLVDLGQYLTGLNDTVEHCTLIEEQSELLSSKVETLNNSILELQNNMSRDFQNCSQEILSCNLTLMYVNTLYVNSNYSKLPSMDIVNDILVNITMDSSSNIYSAYAKSWSEYNSISTMVNITTIDTLTSIQQGLLQLDSNFKFFINITSSILTAINFQQAQEDLEDDIQPWIKIAGIATFSICLFLSSVILAVVITAYIGLTIGSCCERPSTNGEGSCCTRNQATTFLLCSNCIIFSLTWLIMAGITVLIILGAILHNDVCKQMVAPSDDYEATQTLDKIAMSRLDVNISLLGTIEGCKNNTAIYIAANVESLGPEYNVTYVLDPDNYGITDALWSLPLLNYTLVEELVILNNELEFYLLDLDKAFDIIDFDTFYKILRQNATNKDLSEFSYMLEIAANTTEDEEISDLFSYYSDIVNDIQSEQVLPMSEIIDNLQYSLSQVEHYKYFLNISIFLANFTVATESIDSAAVSDTVDILTQNIYNDLTALVTNTDLTIQNQIGQCYTVYHSFSISSEAFCIDFLYPFNAFWFVLGFCLAFALPLLCMQYKLSSYYSKTEKFTEPFTSFTRMSFHRNHAKNQSHRSRSNHGNDIQAEIAMQRLNNSNRYSSRRKRNKDNSQVSAEIHTHNDQQTSLVDDSPLPAGNPDNIFSILQTPPNRSRISPSANAVTPAVVNLEISGEVSDSNDESSKSSTDSSKNSSEEGSFPRFVYPSHVRPLTTATVGRNRNFPAVTQRPGTETRRNRNHRASGPSGGYKQNYSDGGNNGVRQRNSQPSNSRNRYPIHNRSGQLQPPSGEGHRNEVTGRQRSPISQQMYPDNHDFNVPSTSSNRDHYNPRINMYPSRSFKPVYGAHTVGNISSGTRPKVSNANFAPQPRPPFETAASGRNESYNHYDRSNVQFKQSLNREPGFMNEIYF